LFKNKKIKPKSSKKAIFLVFDGFVLYPNANQCASTSKAMPTRILFLSFLLCLSTAVFAQTTGVKRATFSSSIGSSTYPQSIGQSSAVIGSSRVQSYDLLQGFLAPDFPIVSRSREPLELIRLQAYPNPFTSQVKLKLDRSYPYPLQLQLFSISGFSVWSGEFPAHTKELNLDQLDHLSVGVYLLRLYTTQQVFTQTLIKH
jgi:hypothetical protein